MQFSVHKIMKKIIWFIPIILTLFAGIFCEEMLKRPPGELLIEEIGLQEERDASKTKLDVKNKSQFNFGTIWICRENEDGEDATTNILIGSIEALNMNQEDGVELKHLPSHDSIPVYLWIQYTTASVQKEVTSSTYLTEYETTSTNINTNSSKLTWTPCPWILPKEEINTDTNTTNTNTNTSNTSSSTTTTFNTGTTTLLTGGYPPINQPDGGVMFFPTNVTVTTYSSIPPFYLLKRGYNNKIEMTSFSVLNYSSSTSTSTSTTTSTTTTTTTS